MIVRSMSASACVLVLAALTGCGASQDDHPPDATRPSGSAVTIRVPADAPTISAATGLARRGDRILVSPGTYRETVTIGTPDVTLRGTDRNSVIIDGQVRRPNGVVVTAAGVSVENLTVRDNTLNGVLVTGMHDGDGGLAKGSDGYTRLDPAKFPPIEGFAVRYVTSTNNGLYGIYAFDARRGVIEHTYTSGSPDSGIYVGQCSPCHTVVRANVAERNAVGYEGTNASSQLVVTGNRFSHNRVGMTTNSDYQEALVPQRDAVFAGNVISDNDEPNSPAQADGGWGVGVGIAGSRENLVSNNLIAGNPGAGVVIASVEDLAPVGNRVSGNRLTGNRVDLVYAASQRAPGRGNCVQLPSGATTEPTGVAAKLACPNSTSSPGVDLRLPTGPAGVPFTEVPRPGRLPSLPDAVSAPYSPARGVDLPDTSTVPVPSSNLLADQSFAR